MLTPEKFGFTALVVIGVILLVLVSSVAFRLIEMRSRMGTLFYRVEAKLDLLLEQANMKLTHTPRCPAKLPKPCGQVKG